LFASAIVLEYNSQEDKNYACCSLLYGIDVCRGYDKKKCYKKSLNSHASQKPRYFTHGLPPVWVKGYVSMKLDISTFTARIDKGRLSATVFWMVILEKLL